MWAPPHCVALRHREASRHEPARRWLAGWHHDAPRGARTVRSHTRRLRMSERQRMTTRLTTLFQRPALFVLAGGINPIGAKMAGELGYDAFYMFGGNIS